MAVLLATTLPAISVQALNLTVTPGLFEPQAQTQPIQADVDELIARAKASVTTGAPSLKADLDSLFVVLLRSRDLPDRYNLIDAIADIGDLRDSNAPVAVKNYVRSLALIVLPKLPEEVRLHAGSSWARLFPSRKEMDRDIGVVAPDSRDEEAAGLKVLRARKLGVSYDALQEAVTTADLELTHALLRAGLRVDMVNIEATYRVVWPSLRSACADTTIPPDRINGMIDLLVGRNYPIAYTDSFGDSLLFMAASDCPGAVVGHIADLGVVVDAPDRKGVTPLEMALQSDRFDAADALMERGARLSRTAGKRVLFQPRQDARRADYVKRATRTETDAAQ
ncbi:hypothetical protein [Labrys neptuniae]